MDRKSNFKASIPNRWLHCPRKATSLIAEKFMAFKTPLSERYDDQVPVECRFPPEMLFTLCKSRKIKFGLWIDLTNTSRFYDKRVVEDEGCKYVKLQCRGHGEAPSEEQTKAFIGLVHKFIANHPLESIAVHCTHGFNRTGFLIVSYLVEKMDCAIEIALEMFARVRAPGIYKRDYLEELYRRYGDVDDTPPPPMLPDWCFEEDNKSEDSGFGSQNACEEETQASTSNEGGSSRNNRRFGQRSKAVFMQGVPGVSVFVEQPKAYQLQKKVQAMCGWKGSGFPGSQPVSMDIHNIKLLHQKPYRVSWKADGMRYMMLIDGFDEVYFFDRDHNIFKVKGLEFPHRKDLKRHLRNTLLDGEMVIDKVNGVDIPRYLAYDIIRFEDQEVGKTPFYPTRLQCIEYEIINARVEAMKKGLIVKSSEPFSVRKKDFWDIRQTAYLLGEKFAKSLSHEPDGLIFQPSKEPYVAGRCDEVLKWKPLSMNSIDFRLKIVKEGGLGKVETKKAYLFVGQSDQPSGQIKYTSALKELDGKIIECKFADGQWQLMRERTDKSFPNGLNTAKAVWGSIQTPVTKEKLLEFIERYRFEDDTEMMPPPPKKVKR